MAWWSLSIRHGRGDVVRIAPDEVSFASAEAWKEIYGHATGGHKTFVKGLFYQSHQHPGIVAVRDLREHARQRKYLANAFSARALRGQEPIVRHYVDQFIIQAGKLGAKGGPGLDLEQAFSWLTFDIISDLTFGESLNAIASGRQHPWVSVISDSSFFTSVASLQRRIPLLKLVLPWVLPKDMPERAARHRSFTKEKTLKRIQMANELDRPDFFQHLLSKGGDEVHLEELIQQSNNLMVAGSETTSNFLNFVSYQLLKDKRCMDELVREVRSAFQTPADITADRCSELPYLNAVIEEGLRIGPPVPFGPPRTSPGAVVGGVYLPPGTTAAVDMWAVHHNPRYWKEPYAFRPERWIGDGLGDDKTAFNPFLTGPRSCLGINLAYIEMRLTLTLLIFNYDWELVDEDLDLWRDVRTHMFWKKPSLFVRYHPVAAGGGL
ncbi:hypothetical protein KJ359_006287 [Pestalotiopsis sp. 9143b]|nr:hypothetical protein KJ359_006287 [Pestalotiopsis sp. 9143b]